MFFLLLLLGWILAEIALFVVVGDAAGLLPTLAAVVAGIVVGIAMIRYQGLSVRARVLAALARDKPPVTEMLDGFGLVLGGICLILPGFATDAFGLLLLVPPFRRAVLVGLVLWLRRRASVVIRRWTPRQRDGRIIDGEYDDLTPRDDPRLPPDDRDRR